MGIVIKEVKEQGPQTILVIAEGKVQMNQWVREFGSELDYVDFKRVTKPKDFRYKHARKNRVLVLDESSELVEHIPAKLTTISGAKRVAVENYINRKKEEGGVVNAFMTMAFGKEIKSLNAEK